MKLISCLFFTLAVFLLNASEIHEIEGNWTGAVDLGTFSCVEQNFTLPIEAISYQNAFFSFQIPQLHLSYEGTFSNGEISGTFIQGKEFPLTLKRGMAIAPVRARPQVDAINPDLYINEELRIKNGDVTLAGTLTLPKGDGPFTTVIFIGDFRPSSSPWHCVTPS